MIFGLSLLIMLCDFVMIIYFLNISYNFGKLLDLSKWQKILIYTIKILLTFSLLFQVTLVPIGKFFDVYKKIMNNDRLSHCNETPTNQLEYLKYRKFQHFMLWIGDWGNFFIGIYILTVIYIFTKKFS